MSIVHSYRVKVTKTTESLRYLDELEKQSDDPISFIKEKIKRISELQNTSQSSITLSIQEGTHPGGLKSKGWVL